MTDRFLPVIPRLLSSRGLFYLVTIAENDPGESGVKQEAFWTTSPHFFPSFSPPLEEIMRLLGQRGLRGESWLAKRAGNERLSVLRFQKS